MAFFWWSDSSTTYRDMESIEIECDRCQGIQKHTFRLYEKKDKAYSAITMSTEKHVSAICHGCLVERELEKKYEQEMLEKYAKEDIVREAFRLSEAGKYKEAIKKYDKILKKDPAYPHAIYGKANCLMSLGNYSEARPYVDDLLLRYPDDHDIAEMKSNLEKKCMCKL